MRVEIEYTQARTARARMVDDALRVRMPGHWPKAMQDETLAKFRRWASRHAKRMASLPPAPEPTGTIWTPQAFDAYVRALNDQTLRVPVQAVRIGSARRSRLAQANTRTRVLTFSRHAINGMPERALRYLVLHELAHLKEANHSPRFWALVEAFEPDYKAQRAIALAHHSRAIDRLERQDRQEPAPTPAPPIGDPEAHPFGPLFAFLPRA